MTRASSRHLQLSHAALKLVRCEVSGKMYSLPDLDQHTCYFPFPERTRDKGQCSMVGIGDGLLGSGIVLAKPRTRPLLSRAYEAVRSYVRRTFEIRHTHRAWRGWLAYELAFTTPAVVTLSVLMGEAPTWWWWTGKRAISRGQSSGIMKNSWRAH